MQKNSSVFLFFVFVLFFFFYPPKIRVKYSFYSFRAAIFPTRCECCGVPFPCVLGEA